MIRLLLDFYHKAISPITHSIGQALFGPHFACRFTPTCSQYARLSIKRYGIITGARMALLRFIRCQPFSRGGFDPVPDKIK